MTTTLGFTISENLKNKGIKNIEYINDDGGLATISIYRQKHDEPWNIPVSPKFEEISKLIDTFINGELDADSKQELKQCIKDNLDKLPWEKYNEKVDADNQQWFITLREKYKNLQKIADKNFKGLWESIEFELSVQKILNIKDCSLPFIGILLGPSGASKTLGLEMFRSYQHIFFTDKFSARAFVSHSTAVKREELEKIDLLPKIKNKFFLTPELSTMFASKDEDLMETLSIITRIADGHGFENDTGAHGHRGYNEDIMFTWVGAVVDISWKVHKCLGTLGPKLYFYRMPLIERKKEEYVNQIENDDFAIKMSEVKNALIDYLEYFDKCPKSIVVDNLNKIKWDNSKSDKKTSDVIYELGKLLAHLRALADTYENDDSQGLDYAYKLVNKEDPTRAMTQLRNLARGHALSQGRNYLTMEDMPLLIKVVMSTASIERTRIFELLIAHGGKITTTTIAKSINMSNPAAKRTMAELIAIGLVDLGPDVPSEHGSPQKQIVLKNEFNWFISDEFQSVRKITPYYSKLNNEKEHDNERLGGEIDYAIHAIHNIGLDEKILPCNNAEQEPESTVKIYDCYECRRINHGTPKYQTNSLSDYQHHWISSGHTGPCQPGIADLELHGWSPQGKEWEI